MKNEEKRRRYWVGLVEDSPDDAGDRQTHEDTGCKNECLLQFFDDGLDFVGDDELVLVEEVRGFFPDLTVIPAGLFVENFGVEESVFDVIPAEIEPDQQEEWQESCTGSGD